MITSEETGLSDDMIVFANARYAARLKRNKSEPDHVVAERFSLAPFADFIGSSKSPFDAGHFGVSPHFCVGVEGLLRFAADPNVKLGSVGKITESGRELRRIEYSYVEDNPKTEMHAERRGSVFLDPARCWCVYRSTSDSKMSIKGRPALDQTHDTVFETIEHSSGFPLVKSSTSKDRRYNHTTKTESVSTTRIDYEWEVNDSVPDTEFTLSAFGLPEPVGNTNPVPAPSRWYLWVLAAAGACAALAVGFRLLGRRKSIPPNP